MTAVSAETASATVACPSWCWLTDHEDLERPEGVFGEVYDTKGLPGAFGHFSETTEVEGVHVHFSTCTDRFGNEIEPPQVVIEGGASLSPERARLLARVIERVSTFGEVSA